MLKVASFTEGALGTVTLINTGTGLTGGPITTAGTISLANTTVVAGVYGNASAVSQVTIDAQGRINSASNVVISIPSGQVTGLGTMATQNANAVAITGGTINSVAHTGGTFATANITSVAATFPNSYLTNSSATLGNTSVTLGGTTTTVGNLTVQNVTISSVATTFPNSFLANSSATLGNTAVTLGSTVTSVGNLTVNNETVNGLTAAIATKTGNYSLTSVDCTVLGNAATGNISITLPTAVGAAGRFYTVKKVDSTANTVTVATTSAQTIDGQASKVLSIQYDGIQVQSDNANWVVIANTFGRNGTAGSF